VNVWLKLIVQAHQVTLMWSQQRPWHMNVVVSGFLLCRLYDELQWRTRSVSTATVYNVHLIVWYIMIYEPLRAGTARRRPTYSVKLHLWKVSTFYFKIVARPTPLTITVTPRRQTRRCLLISLRTSTMTEYALKSVAVQQFQNYVEATACSRRCSTVTG